MTNLQLYFSIGIPTLAVMISMLLNILQIAGIRSELQAFREETRAGMIEIHADIRELRQQIANLVTAVNALAIRVALLENPTVKG